MSTWSGPKSRWQPSPDRPSTGWWRSSSGSSPSGTRLSAADRRRDNATIKGELHMNTKIASMLLAGAFSLAAFQAAAADKVTLQLKWVTQAQFGGYYVAKDKGFYEEEGLDVEIKPGGPDIAPAQVIAGGGADVVVDWMPSALATREKGVPLVNIAQPFKSSGMML